MSCEQQQQLERTENDREREREKKQGLTIANVSWMTLWDEPHLNTPKQDLIQIRDLFRGKMEDITQVSDRRFDKLSTYLPMRYHPHLLLLINFLTNHQKIQNQKGYVFLFLCDF